MDAFKLLPVGTRIPLAKIPELYEIVRKLAETIEECGYWPDTSHSQVKLGDLGREARDLLDKLKEV